MMDQGSIGLFLDTRIFSASGIDEQFAAVLCSDAIACSSVTKYLKEMRCTADKQVT
jgi:hypothetical protein